MPVKRSQCQSGVKVFAMTDEFINEFLSDRKIAFEKFTMKSIRQYSKKYDIKIPKDKKDFWLGAHRARINMKNVDKRCRDESLQWLAENGYSVFF